MTVYSFVEEKGYSSGIANQRLMICDLFCFNEDPNYEATHDPDYFFNFNISTAREEILVKALMMIPMVDKKYLCNLKFANFLKESEEKNINNNPTLIRQISKIHLAKEKSRKEFKKLNDETQTNSIRELR